ncbi:MAG: hypothetical protein M0Z75_17960 [Nitrospiraceae bacterium]|nr:hypothetical protein [Nitrospiraceae bacterium]
MARRHSSRSIRAIELAKERLDAGLLSEKFPQISKITILATYYYDRKGSVLMVRTINVFPNSSACFHLQCPIKDCALGFDLGPDIMELIRKGGKSAKGSAACSGKDGSDASIHSSISYEITIQYNSASRSDGHAKSGSKGV